MDEEDDFDMPSFGNLKPAKCLKENEVELSEFSNKEKQVIYYTYDFGDNWEHAITLEKINLQIMEAELKYQICLGGEMAYPIEDCEKNS